MKQFESLDILQEAFIEFLKINKNEQGEMAEWLKAPAWKACILLKVSRVRIPFSPPKFINFYTIED